MTNTEVGLLLMVVAALVVAGFAIARWRLERKALLRERVRIEGWRNEQRLRREARWAPEFHTDVGVFRVELIREVVTGTGRSVLNRLSIGEVDEDEPEFDKQMEELVVRARARMADLNAFIDSYVGPPSS